MLWESEEVLIHSEYIQLLRQHVAKGRKADGISSKQRHLDRSSFWKSRYERTKESLKEAEDRAVDLRREIEVLKSKVDAVRPSTASRKRKKHDLDTVPVPRSPKKTKRAASPTRFAPLDILTDVGEESGDAGETGKMSIPTHREEHSQSQEIFSCEASSTYTQRSRHRARLIQRHSHIT